MPPKKPPAAVLQRARENGSESNREGIDDTIVQGRILLDTEKRYDGRVDLWEAYVSYPSHPFDLLTPVTPDFVLSTE
jgi:hypothetical protein